MKPENPVDVILEAASDSRYQDRMSAFEVDTESFDAAKLGVGKDRKDLTAFEEGYEAFEVFRFDEDANPHPRGTPENSWWYEGWKLAVQEAKDDLPVWMEPDL